jgi:uncharacterized protein YceK
MRTFLRGVGLLGLVVSGCGTATQFELTANGVKSGFASAHASMRGDGETRWLVVCGDYAGRRGWTDTGGSVCFDVLLLAAQLSTSPLTLGGLNIQADDGTRSFTPTASASPALVSAWLEFDCFCPPLATQQLDGVLTLRTVEAHRLAGALDVTIVSQQLPYVVHASFDVCD